MIQVLVIVIASLLKLFLELRINVKFIFVIWIVIVGQGSVGKVNFMEEIKLLKEGEV